MRIRNFPQLCSSLQFVRSRSKWGVWGATNAARGRIPEARRLRGRLSDEGNGSSCATTVTSAPELVPVVPVRQVWVALPEVNRQSVVGQLVRLASRALSAAATTIERDRR
jgi:hypothetical protein